MNQINFFFSDQLDCYVKFYYENTCVKFSKKCIKYEKQIQQKNSKQILGIANCVEPNKFHYIDIYRILQTFGVQFSQTIHVKSDEMN